jgi:TetR/AcrR family transcriptional regulator, cholesterol catabolism regulator
VAAHLFRKKGYATTTTREIAESLNLQKGSLYHHIRKKEDLLQRICFAALTRLQEQVALALAEAEPDRRLRAMISTHVAVALEDRDLHAVMLIELRSLADGSRAEVVARRDEYERMVYETLVEEQRAGRVRAEIEPKLLTLALLDLLNWVIFWYQPGGRLSPSELGGVLTDIYLNGARSAPSGVPVPRYAAIDGAIGVPVIGQAPDHLPDGGSD